jgi:thiol:disulfide interchange protein DsbD
MQRRLNIYYQILLVWIGILVSAQSYSAQTQPLPPEQAFQLSVVANDQQHLTLQWRIAPDYYLYQQAIKIITPASSGVQIEAISLPRGETKQDSVHGIYQAYRGTIQAEVTLKNRQASKLVLNIGYQGCAAEGFCYSPIAKNITINLARLPANTNLTPYLASINSISNINISPSGMNTKNSFPDLFNHNWFIMLLGFLGLGVLLAFTPCVLPMLPILSGIIMGHHKKHGHHKLFKLSFSYVMGMAVAYAILGIIIALIGSRITTDFQQPSIVVLFSALFVLLAGSLFGFYTLRIPSRWLGKINNWSNRLQGGSYLGVFLMGALSTLIVSPCVTAPLVGVLAYISQTGSVVIGGLALFALGIGMGIPLLMIGLSARRFLPRAGAWMHNLEKLFGFLLLAVAVWLLSRILPSNAITTIWMIWLLGVLIYIIHQFKISAGKKWLVDILVSITLLMGAYYWQDVSPRNAAFAKNMQQLKFIPIKNLSELNQALAKARQSGRGAMLDFYADWCISCVAMDQNVFTKPEVQAALEPLLLMRVDLTEDSAAKELLLKKYGVYGPPTLLFFANNGSENTKYRIVGEINAKNLLQHITSYASELTQN